MLLVCPAVGRRVIPLPRSAHCGYNIIAYSGHAFGHSGVVSACTYLSSIIRTRYSRRRPSIAPVGAGGGSQAWRLAITSVKREIDYASLSRY